MKANKFTFLIPVAFLLFSCSHSSGEKKTTSITSGNIPSSSSVAPSSSSGLPPVKQEILPISESELSSGRITRNEKTFVFSGLSKGSGDTHILNGGYFKNESPLKGLVSLKITIDAPSSFAIKYGYTYGTHDFVSKTYSHTVDYHFNDDHPTYFEIVPSLTTYISKIEVSYNGQDYVSPFVSKVSDPAIEITPHTYKEPIYPIFPSFDETPGLSYHLSDDGTYYIVDNYSNTMEIGEDNRLVIPNTHEGKPVKQVGYHGFTGRWWIFEVYIPENVEVIENETFSECGITKLYWDARHCEDFHARNAIFTMDEHNHQNIEVVFGPHVERIPSNMFLPSLMTPNVHPKVSKVSFVENCPVTSIGDYAFYGLSDLKEIHLPNTLTEIGNYAFYETGLTEIDLNQVETMGDEAFRFCSDLEHVRFTSNTQELGEKSFESCEAITQLDFDGSSITSLPYASFKDCSNLKKVNFSSSITSIGESCFENDTELETILLPDSLTELGPKSFKNTAKLGYLKLNKNLKTIGNSAFEGTVKLSNLVIDAECLNDLPLNNKVFLNSGHESHLSVYVDKDVLKLPSNFFYSSSNVSTLPNIENVYVYHALDIRANAFFGVEVSNFQVYCFDTDFSTHVIGDNNDAFNNAKVRTE